MPTEVLTAPIHPQPSLMKLRDRAFTSEDETEPWQRGLIATEVWRDHPEWPVVLKRAEVSARCLERIPPSILPEDRFAGFVFRRLRVHAGVSDPDGWRNLAKHPEMHGYRESWPLPPDVRRAYAWWKENGVQPQPLNNARLRHPWLTRYGIANPHGRVGGHTLPDHGILLTSGIKGLRERIADSLKRNRSPRERDQLCAMDRILQGLQAHCLVCADAAREKARAIGAGEQKNRLLLIADDCEALAAQPPDTLAQALQLILFSNCADILETTGDACSFGRIDQLLYPFYKKDLLLGRLDDETAFDLIGRFLAKKWCRQTSNNLCVGGLKPDGTDGTNELSHLFLQAMEATGITSNISVRVHSGTSDDFMTLVARVMRAGFGRGGIYNDDVTIEALVRKGVAIEDARDYAPLGCVEVMIPGRSSFRTMGFNLNPMKVLELFLNQGRCLVTGDQVWDDVPETFASFNDLLNAYRARIREIVDIGVEIIAEDERQEEESTPHPWLTVLSHGGIESARDLTAGQPKYNPVGVTLIGVADVANSLYALRRLVYREKRLSLEELRTILSRNWEVQEVLRTEVIQRFPRFGQDASEINALVRNEAAHYAACFETHRTYYGDRFWPMIFGVSAGMHKNQAPKTGATPSGRRKGETLAHSLQPSPAGPRGCITDVLAACTAVDLREFPGGISNVQDCDPIFVKGEEGLRRLVTLLQGYVASGGMELSLNFLSEAQLRAAQNDPDAHLHLMVRLFGLSVRFVSLSRELQESVIERVRAAEKRAS